MLLQRGALAAFVLGGLLECLDAVQHFEAAVHLAAFRGVRRPFEVEGGAQVQEGIVVVAEFGVRAAECFVQSGRETCVPRDRANSTSGGRRRRAR